MASTTDDSKQGTTETKSLVEHLLLWVACITLALPATLQAQSDSQATTPSQTNAPVTATTKPKPWSGPDTSDGFDWIELTSGEWLKGEIKTMYDDELEFDSDELDLQRFDWEDVKQLKTDNPQTVRTESKEEYSGAIHINEDTVTVTSTNGVVEEFNRVDLLSLIEGHPKEINYWSLKLSAGVTLQSGNTKQTDMNLSIDIQRRTAANRLLLDYMGIISAVDDVETANNHRGNAAFDIFLTRKLFLRPVFASYYRDTFQNIDSQGTLGIAVGWHLIDTSKTEWDVSCGPGFQYTKFSSVQAGESSTASTLTFVGSTVYETELTGWLDLEAKYRFSLMNEVSGTFSHHALVGLEVELTSVLDLNFSIVWDRIQNPQTRADASVPLQDDFRMIFGVGVDI